MSDPTPAAAPAVVMYATGWCPYCSRARRLLEGKGVAFEEIDIDAAAGARAQMLSRSGGRTSVPQIFIGDTHVGGYDVMMALHRAGKLEPLLAGGGA